MGATFASLLPEGKTASDVIMGHASDAAGRVFESATGKPGQISPNRSET